MNGLILFANENEIEGLTNHDVYDSYCVFCEKNNFEAMEFHKFIIRLCAMYGYTTKQVGSRRVIIPKSEDIYDKGLNEFLCERDENMFENLETKEVYSIYEKMCRNEGYYVLSRVEFSRRICKELGIKTKQVSIDGIRRYVFVID